MSKPNRERLIKIKSNYEQLSSEISAKNITEEQILNDRFIQWAVTTPLFNIGEHVAKLTPEFKKQYDNVPWSKISGLRNRLVHNYEATNWTFIAEVIFKDLPILISDIDKILSESTEDEQNG